MNRALFIELSKSLNLVEPIHSEGLGDLVKSFPFFQSARVLHCLSLKRGQEISYPEALKSAALHTSNRKRLFEILESKVDVVNNSKEIKVKEELDINHEPDFQFEKEERIKKVMQQSIPTEEIIQKIMEYPVIIELPKMDDLAKSPEGEVPVLEDTNQIDLVKAIEDEIVIDRELTKAIHFTNKAEDKITENTFLFWLKKLGETEGQDTKTNEVQVKPSKSKDELIDNFIKTEPRISTPQKTEFYSPIAASKKSSEDSEEIVSETLAKIYISQSNTGKAIRIYQKLILLYPEKSSYFAGLIKNLEKTDLS